MFSASVVSMIINGVWETIYMTLLSTFLAYVLGLPLGVALFVTGERRHFLLRCLNKVLGFVTNLLRSIPFLILLIAILPFTRSIVGTTIGSKATVVPLVIAAAPLLPGWWNPPYRRWTGGSLKRPNLWALRSGRSSTRFSCRRPGPLWLQGRLLPSQRFWAIPPWLVS